MHSLAENSFFVDRISWFINRHTDKKRRILLKTHKYSRDIPKNESYVTLGDSLRLSPLRRDSRVPQCKLPVVKYYQSSNKEN